MKIGQVIKEIKENGVKRVRFQTSDYFGLLREKSVSDLETLKCGVRFLGVGLYGTDILGGVAEESGVSYEMEYRDFDVMPDLSTFKVIPWEKETARVLCDVFLDGAPYPGDPRFILKKTVDECSKMGFAFQAAGELEFYLLKDKMPYTPARRYVYTLREGGRKVLPELVNALKAMDIDPICYNHEYGAGQFEVNLKHRGGLIGSDDCFTFRMLVKEIAEMRGLRATFMAKPFTTESGSSFHIHMSLVEPDTGRNLFFDPDDNLELSDQAYHFIGGLLKYARPSFAIFAPTINSYKRLKPFSFAPNNITWGLDNRSTYVRVPSDRGEYTRVELRAPDASANPYLTFALALSSGLQGIKEKIDPGLPFKGDAYELTDPTFDIPHSLQEAMKYLKDSETVRSIFGNEFIKSYFALKEVEVREYNVRVSDWEIESYLDI